MRVEIMYFGRPSEFLLMTSERLELPEGVSTLQQVLNKLRNRGTQWAYELDDRYVVCTVNHKVAHVGDSIRCGNEIGIFSTKPLLEA